MRAMVTFRVRRLRLVTGPPPGQPIRSPGIRGGHDGDTQMKGATGTEFSRPVPKLAANGWDGLVEAH